MTCPELPRSAAVILAYATEFQRIYVQTALERAGATIIGAVRSIGEVRELLATHPAPHVIMASILADGLSCPLAEELHDRGIAHMVLVSRPEHIDPIYGLSPALQEPFAAYQVVDWLVQSQASTLPV